MTEIIKPFTLDVTINEADITAIQWLAKHCDLPKQRLKDAMSKGAAWIQTENGSKQRAKPIRRASKILATGSRLSLYYDPKVLQQTVPAPQLIHENTQYSVWNKPSGMLSHGSKWGDHCAIVRWVEHHHQPQRSSFLIHRLDRAASGIIIIGHTKKATALLCGLFENRHISKRYHAIVEGEFPDAETLITTPIDNRKAVTIARKQAYNPATNKSLLDVSIETGRKHQIRQHLLSLGHPIVGDRHYNPHNINHDTPDLQLRAYSLSFECPISHKNQSFTLNNAEQLCL